MSERRSYWVSAGMAFANPVEGGIHCREVLTDEDASQSCCSLYAENVRLRDLLKECQFCMSLKVLDVTLLAKIEKEVSDE